MADDVKIQVVAAPVTEATPAPAVVSELTDHIAIIAFVEREMLKIPGARSKSLYSLQEGDRGFNRGCLTFKFATDYTVTDEEILKPWKTAFNLRLWQKNAEACKAKTPSGWLRDNLTCEVSETVTVKYWTFRFSSECLPVLREQIAVEKGSAAVGARRVTDVY